MSRRRASLVLTAGVVLLVAGVAGLFLVPTSTAGFGWFAYAPLSEATFSPGVFLRPVQLWAGAAALVGLAAASWAVGYLAGRRADRRP